MTNSNQPTYSISFRLRRTTVEEAFVSVPVTSDIIAEQADGDGRLDFEKLVERAIAIGSTPDCVWQVEECKIDPHPIQKPPASHGNASQ